MGIEAVRKKAIQALRPPPKIALADWIEANIFLPAAASATPGRMRLWKFQRGWCEAVDNPDIERITIMKGARIGYTQWLSATISSWVANSPAPIIALQPTADDSRDYAVTVEELFESSPAIRGLLSDERDEAGRTTLLSKRFAGGSLKFLAAKSPRNLRRHTARFLAEDEIDAYESGQEGDPLKLAEMRTFTFRDRKILAGSTPIFETGPITRNYEESDKRIFEVSCPECAAFNEIKWKDIRWDEGKPETASWCCPECGSFISESHKTVMVENGRWRATAPHVNGHAGFRVNCLVSLHYNARWSKLVEEFLVAKKAPETLQVFANTILGEPWKLDGDELDQHELFGLREAFALENLPGDVLWLTAGVDCQDDRLEVTTVGHGASDIFVLDHRVFWGPIDGDSVWRELDDYLQMTWKHPKGGTLKIDACCVDSGDGGHTEIVYAFTRPRFNRRVVCIKGVAGFSRSLLERSVGKGQLLWLAGVDALKSLIFARLTRGEGLRFSEVLAPVYFEQLTSERRVVRYVRGVPQARFERIKGKRAESLDATAYAIAARQLIGQNMEQRAAEVASPAAPKVKSSMIRSAWLSRD
ncbi:phage terminase large subunit family protein [Agrobacterium pusense]|uniref:phage terminase large subunit family protein n=1 Tax=Agrobacterium pusense TaxID=648995 RepID=UPI000D1A518C|nr:terminase gpA endonuclease subunit [Agrobacterium pusense]